MLVKSNYRLVWFIAAFANRLFLCLDGALFASSHDTDFVFARILGVFYLIGALIFYPAEAGYIDHVC